MEIYCIQKEMHLQMVDFFHYYVSFTGGLTLKICSIFRLAVEKGNDLLVENYHAVHNFQHI